MLAKIVNIDRNILIIINFTFFLTPVAMKVFKDIYHCLIEIIKGLADKGQFQYLTNLKRPQEGIYLYTTQFHSQR